jgi:hypothetical protein
MSGICIGDQTLTFCAQKILFAGRPILLRTNAPRIAAYVSDCFPAVDDVDRSAACAAEVTIVVQDKHPVQGNASPWFRGRGEFAVARFTPSDTLWFNLRTRVVFGSFSTAMAADRERWRRHIFPTLIGILAATIDIAPVHAACLSRNHRGFLLAGPSGIGKSTLSVSLSQRGYAFLSDDWTCLTSNETDVDAWSLPMPIKLLPDASRFFPELQKYQVGVSLNGEMAYEVSPEHGLGLLQQKRCTIACVVLLKRIAQRGCFISEIDEEEAIEHLVRELEPLEGHLATCYERQISIIRRLKGAACFQVCFNDSPHVVAEALDDAFSSMADV